MLLSVEVLAGLPFRVGAAAIFERILAEERLAAVFHGAAGAMLFGSVLVSGQAAGEVVTGPWPDAHVPDVDGVRELLWRGTAILQLHIVRHCLHLSVKK